ncbi:hypothetical protein ACOSQ3_023066 [Xanthoceras sorbifolium]
MALKEEVDKLLANRFIRESYYPNWLANPVLVKKKNNKWRTKIEANLEKIKALRDMRSPTKPKHVQSLNEQVAALSLFISKSTNKCVPFFNVLRGNKKLEWTEECELVFQQLKEYIGRAPLLSKLGDSARDKHGIGAGRKQEPTASLLYKQEAVGRGEQISADGETRILPGGGVKEVATLLLSPQYRSIANYPLRQVLCNSQVYEINTSNKE